MTATNVEPTDQLGFDGMPTRLYSCTPSRVGTWLDCPRRYRMTYLDRPQPPKGAPWAHNSLGASVHNALAGWWRLVRAKRTPESAAALLESGWIGDGFRDEEHAAVWRSRARDMVQQYTATLDPYDEPIGVERTVAATTSTLALSGRIDRLDERVRADATELVVVDYKTGRSVPTDDEARGSLALAVYAVAAARTLRKICRRVELHHLPTSTVAAFEHTPESLQRQIGRVELAAAEAQAADAAYAEAVIADAVDEVFPPRPSTKCGWCDFRRHCPEGRAAAPERRSWDGLAGEADLA
ncbi:MAG: RecB family exonuclease [Actinomycetes bacterium]